MNTDEQIALDKYIAHLIWGLMLVPPKERSERSLMRIVSKIKQSILKAIMDKLPKYKHKEFKVKQINGRGRVVDVVAMAIESAEHKGKVEALEQFESVIKEVLSEAKK